jgi:hypothetical protein
VPAGPFQKVILIENALVMLRDNYTKKMLSPKLARQDFFPQIFAQSIKRLGTAALEDYY